MPNSNDTLLLQYNLIKGVARIPKFKVYSRNAFDFFIFAYQKILEEADSSLLVSTQMTFEEELLEIVKY